jgi:hypothetical protein
MKLKTIVESAEAPRTLGGFPVRVLDIEQSGVDEEASPMIRPPGNRFDSKAEAFAHAREHGGRVFKRTYTDPNTGRQQVSFVVKKDVAEGEPSPMFKDAQRADRIRSLKNLIAIAREQGRQLRVQELELELKKLQGLSEGAGNIGNSIKALYQKIYDQGDDEIEYFYNDSPVFAQYWDEYEGDLDSIIAEVNPKELQIIHDELESYAENAGLMEALKLNAPQQNISRDELQGYANRIKTGTKTKRDKFAPIIHGSNIKAITKDAGGTEWDLDDLARQITTRPRAILGTNAKMEKSKTEGEIIYDLTLPALSGIVVDEESGDFVEIKTCPGAGECQLFCYARKGGYVMFPASSMSAAQALNFLVNDPAGYMATVNKEIAGLKAKTDKAGIQLVVRWHDAGDFFSKEYLDLAYDVANANPDVKFYAYTKMGDVATGAHPKNFIINFSSGSKSGETKKVELHKAQGNTVKQGVTVPKDMFFDLIARRGNSLIKDAKGRTQFASPEALETFKDRLAQQYKVPRDSIITYDEMLARPEGPQPKWNVIVQPGAGDRAANRLDVIDSYLMFH